MPGLFEDSYKTYMHKSKIAPKSLVIVFFSCFTSEAWILFLEKSKTSSERSFKIFRAFSHLG